MYDTLETNEKYIYIYRSQDRSSQYRKIVTDEEGMSKEMKKDGISFRARNNKEKHGGGDKFEKQSK
jgi:hypothetical protein